MTNKKVQYLFNRQIFVCNIIIIKHNYINTIIHTQFVLIIIIYFKCGQWFSYLVGMLNLNVEHCGLFLCLSKSKLIFPSPQECVEALAWFIYVWLSATVSGIHGLQDLSVFQHGFLAADLGFQLYAHIAAGTLCFMNSFVSFCFL